MWCPTPLRDSSRRCLAVIVGALCLATAAHAQPRGPETRAVDARLAELSPADEAFLQAYKYAAQNQADKFDGVDDKVTNDHPLRSYIDYWALRLKIGDPRGESSPAGLEARIREFLQRHAGSAVADSLRRDWLLALARRGEWSTFALEYPQLQSKDDTQLQCYDWLGRTQQGQPLADPVREALFQPRDLGEGCGQLLELLAANGTIKRADLQRRLWLSVEANAPGSIRRLAGLLNFDPAHTEQALMRPEKAPLAKFDRELRVIAIARMARNDVGFAAGRLEALQADLPAAERAFAWSQVAAAGMRKLSPEAMSWTRLGLPAVVSDETLVWFARTALREQDWKLLRQVIERMSPRGRADPTWVYWEARALRAAGDTRRADDLLRRIAGEYHFYGTLAAEDLGGLFSAPPRATPPTEAELAVPAANPGFARALKFYALGLRPEGNREWNFQLRAMDDRQLLAAAEWACRKVILDRCVNTADRTSTEHDFSLRFITPFQEQLTPVAKERGLDSAWVYGLIRQESRFLMDARSSVGASGLMQIMPSTARWIAKKLGVADFRVEQLGDMPTNLSFGTYYLKSVLDDLEGSPLLASAAYNAGPNRPRTWRSTLPQPVEGAIFAEIIPFTETRDYVKKVLANATIYSALFSGEPQSLKARLGTVSPRPQSASELP